MTASTDPVVVSGRREAAFAIIQWVLAVTYTVTYCARYGYHRPPESITYVLWFPDWIFYGIVCPWLACIVVSTIYAWRWMGNEPLGPELEAEIAPHVESDHA